MIPDATTAMQLSGTAFFNLVDEIDRNARETGMEQVLEALGTIGLIFLLVVGVLAGLIASKVEGGRNKGRNIAIGVVGALLVPFLVTVAAAGALAAGGLMLIVFVALVGAAMVLLIAHLIFR